MVDERGYDIQQMSPVGVDSLQLHGVHCNHSATRALLDSFFNSKLVQTVTGQHYCSFGDLVLGHLGIYVEYSLLFYSW